LYGKHPMITRKIVGKGKGGTEGEEMAEMTK
jgi:hypothetical protein